MIGKLRRKFILICALSIFTVVAVIFVLIATLNISSMNQTMDTLTDSLSEGNGRFPDSFHSPKPTPPMPSQRPDINIITPETPYATRHFTVWFDKNGDVTFANTDFIVSITDEEAEEYARKSVASKADRGWIANYRYKVYDVKEGVAAVFVDGTMNRAAVMQSLWISGVVLIAAVLVILSLIVLLSGRVMKPIAESYEKQKQFVTDANHELKTPLTLILTNIDIAEAELGENEWLSDIRSEGQRMSELVGQLVALSRMDEEGPPLNRSPLLLSDIVKDTVSEFAVLSEEKGKHLTAEIDDRICCSGDETLLRRLVAVLMDNAVKYCDEGGDIFVSLKGRRHITLTVENSYCAVDEVELDRLFDRFYRIDKARTYTGGYGIGLSIAKSVVEKHNGEITAYRKDSTHIGFKVQLKA